VANESDKIIAEILARTPRDRQGGALCEKADALLLSGDADGAQKCFDKALQIDPRSARAWTGRATVLAKRGRQGEALGCVERALDARAAFAPAVILKAELLGHLGQRAEALACIDQALDSGAEDADLWIRRGRLLEEQQRLDDALASYDRALELGDSAAVWGFRADVLMQKGALDEVARSLERAVAANPEHVESWYRLGRAKLKLHAAAGARDALERFIALAPPHDSRVSAAQKMLSDLAARSAPPSAPERTMSTLPPAPGLAPPARSRADDETSPRSRALLDALDYERSAPAPPPSAPPPALELAVSAAPPAPSTPAEPPPAAPLALGPRLDAVSALFAEGRDMDAFRKLEPLVKEFPDSVDVWLTRARVLVSLGLLDAAVTSLERVTRLDHGHRPAWKLMATCWGDLRRPDLGLEIADRAVSLDHDDPEAHKLRAHFLIELKRIDDARTALHSAIVLAERRGAAAIEDEARVMLVKLDDS